MKHSDFAIGTEFLTCTGQRWRCTDVGQRSVTAIELQPDLEEAWFSGPPYPVPEVVFDEHDMADAFRSPEEATRNALAEVGGLHPGYPHEVVRTMMDARFRGDSCRYPQQRLLRIDRIDLCGEVLHPYAAELTPTGWCILLYAPLSNAFSALPERDFVRLRAAKPVDFEARNRTF